MPWSCEFGLFVSGDHNEYNDAGFVEISKIFAMQGVFVFGMSPFGRFCSMLSFLFSSFHLYLIHNVEQNGASKVDSCPCMAALCGEHNGCKSRGNSSPP